MILRTFAMVALAVSASIPSALAKPGFGPHSPAVHAVDGGGSLQTIIEGLSRPHLVEPQGTPVGISIVPLHHAGYSQQHGVAPVTVHVTQVGVHQAPVIGVSAAPAGAVRDGPLALHASHPLLNSISSPGMVLHGAPVLAGAAYEPVVKPVPVKRVHQEELVPQPYSFGYEISDGHGNKQVRHEESDGHNHKRGSYGFVDAHGVYRQVRYVADHNGFRATIDTNEPGVAAGYSAAAVFKVGQRRARPVVHHRPIPPPPHRVPVVVQSAPPNRLVQKPVGVPAAVPVGHPGVPVGVVAPGGDPALQALQVVQGLHGKALTALPVSSVEYSPALEHSGGVDFIPSAPRLTAATTAGSSLIDPRRSHVTYVEAPRQHPLANLRTSPPVFHEGGPGAHKQH